MAADQNLRTKSQAPLPLVGGPAIAPQSAGQAGISFSCFIIDDEEAIQDLIEGALRPLNCEIQRFKSAKGALAAAARQQPDFIFLDASLEGSDAVEVIRGLGAMQFRGKVQLVSGSDLPILRDLEQVGERHSLWMLPALQKPFRINAIRQLVQDNISNSDPRGTASSDKPPDVSYKKLRLADVLQNNWFQLWYQPKIDLKKMQPVGAEGLARCVHPILGVVRPEAFLAGEDETTLAKLAERALIQSLYDWPLFGALGIPFKLTINCSVESLSRVPIAKIVRELRPKQGNWPGMIIEITEDQAIKDIGAIHEIATQLKLYGVSIAIDDFGAGYSHLARLKELPFAELKIDKSLIQNCDKNEHTSSLCRTAIELAHKFNSSAVAEGVERVEEVRALLQMGCDMAQGYLFAHATPRDKLIQSMHKRLAAKAK